MILQEQKKEQKKALWITILIFIAIILWIAAGIAAFIMSIMCYGKSGTPTQHAIGLILSCLFGPFFFIYYLLSKEYCK